MYVCWDGTGGAFGGGLSIGSGVVFCYVWLGSRSSSMFGTHILRNSVRTHAFSRIPDRGGERDRERSEVSEKSQNDEEFKLRLAVARVWGTGKENV